MGEVDLTFLKSITRFDNLRLRFADYEHCSILFLNTDALGSSADQMISMSDGAIRLQNGKL